MIIDAFSLSLNNIKHKGIRSWLTMLGIFIGIFAVVALISLGNGLTEAINSQFGISSTELISIQAGGLSNAGPPGIGVANPLTTKDLNAVERVRGVKRVIRRNISPGKIEFNDRVVFGIATNIPSGEDRKFIYEQLDLEALDGRLLKDGDSNYVFLGYNFYANKVGLDKKIVPGNKIKVQDKTFTVIGVSKKKGSFIFDNIVYMNEKPLKDLMGYGDKVDIIAVQVQDSEYMQRAKFDIEKELRKSRNVKIGEEDFEVSTPDAALKSVNQVLDGVKIFIFIIASISILVGIIGIINTMTTSVLERRKEIGIMKAIGAKNSHIFLIFLIESGLMGLIGSLAGALAGVAAGYFGTKAINNLIESQTIPEIDLVLIFTTIIAGFIIGAVAGIIPAMNAANQKPVDALRG